MTPLELIYILIASITLLFFGSMFLNAYLKILEIKKQIAEANVKVETKIKFVKVNYENDISVVKELIKDAVKNNAVVNLSEYYDNKALINDNILKENAKNTALNIWTELSEDYKELLAAYTKDPMLFIYKEVYYQTLDVCIQINNEKIKKLNRY